MVFKFQDNGRNQQSPSLNLALPVPRWITWADYSILLSLGFLMFPMKLLRGNLSH